ncbi:MAG: Mur ligase domain-containing protein, partial [Candidatus Rokuibacteriota bacterium]
MPRTVLHKINHLQEGLGRFALVGGRKSAGQRVVNCAADPWHDEIVRYHFSGIAGVGMNPLAQLMRARGHIVQGSDRSF